MSPTQTPISLCPFVRPFVSINFSPISPFFLAFLAYRGGTDQRPAAGRLGGLR